MPANLEYCCHGNGAGDRNRTYDLLITNQLLYQLSYTGGEGDEFAHSSGLRRFRQAVFREQLSESVQISKNIFNFQTVIKYKIESYENINRLIKTFRWTGLWQR